MINLYNLPLKYLFQQAKEASWEKLKQYKNELEFNEKTVQYEVKQIEDNSKLQEKIKLKAEEKIKENISVKSQNTLASINENISFKQMQAQMQFNKNQEPNNEESSKRQNDKFNVFT